MVPSCSYQLVTAALMYKVSPAYGVSRVIAGWGRYRFGASRFRSVRSQVSKSRG